MFYVILLIVASIGPGLAWLWYFYRLDRYEPEPLRFVFKVFAGGLVLVFPAGVLEHFWQPQMVSATHQGDWRSLLTLAFLVVSVIEEGLKSGFLWWLIGKNSNLNEPVDGVIYGITLGLGFASLENFLWAGMFGLGVAALRAVITTLAHATFSGWMGLYIAKEKLAARPGLLPLVAGFLIAWSTHGFYDFLLFLHHPVGSFLAFLLVGGMLFRLFQIIRQMVDESPFRNE